MDDLQIQNLSKFKRSAKPDSLVRLVYHKPEIVDLHFSGYNLKSTFRYLVSMYSIGCTYTTFTKWVKDHVNFVRFENALPPLVSPGGQGGKLPVAEESTTAGGSIGTGSPVQKSSDIRDFGEGRVASDNAVVGSTQDYAALPEAANGACPPSAANSPVSATEPVTLADAATARKAEIASKVAESRTKLEKGFGQTAEELHRQMIEKIK